MSSRLEHENHESIGIGVVSIIRIIDEDVNSCSIHVSEICAVIVSSHITAAIVRTNRDKTVVNLEAEVYPINANITKRFGNYKPATAAGRIGNSVKATRYPTGATDKSHRLDGAAL